VSSPEVAHDPGAEAHPETMRMSLVSAMLTLRMCGTKTVFSLPRYMHFNCAENNLGTVTDSYNPESGARTSKNRHHLSAAGELITWSMANVWNGMVHRLHNSPPEDSDAYHAASKFMYTDDDCKRRRLQATTTASAPLQPSRVCVPWTPRAPRRRPGCFSR
jgi:hypothetical protein